MELVATGALGEPKLFNSTFSMRVKPGDIRTERAMGGGTLYDIGVYCINAARHFFQAEPIDVLASSVNTDRDRLPEIDETTSAVLRFENGRIASFVTSFNATDTGWFEILGTNGRLKMEPAYEYTEGLSYEITVDGRTTRHKSSKRDQFAPELIYFSKCVLEDADPEPSGEEGLQDVRIVTALYEAAETGRAVELPPYEPIQQPSLDQAMRRPPVDKPDTVNVEAPHS
jgi:glucose-fructose oxidoreductase